MHSLPVTVRTQSVVSCLDHSVRTTASFTGRGESRTRLMKPCVATERYLTSAGVLHH